MKHRILLPVLMILLPIMASAQIVVVDGITYNLITKGKWSQEIAQPRLSKYGTKRETVSNLIQ